MDSFKRNSVSAPCLPVIPLIAIAPSELPYEAVERPGPGLPADDLQRPIQSGISIKYIVITSFGALLYSFANRGVHSLYSPGVHNGRHGIYSVASEDQGVYKYRRLVGITFFRIAVFLLEEYPSEEFKCRPYFRHSAYEPAHHYRHTRLPEGVKVSYVIPQSFLRHR